MTVKLVTAAVKAPGFYGLNTQVNAAGLEMNWALKADNLVFDDGGTLGARNGWVKFANAITGTPDFVSIGEYRVSATTEKLLVSTAAKIYASSTTSTIHDTWTDKTAALTITAGYWQFVNHNGEVIGFQSAHVPVYWDGASGTNFALISAKAGYAAPDASMVWGNCGHSAYGRVWASDSTETILLWSAIGTNHQWSSASGGGFADLKITASSWVNGVDKITAITTFQNYLVVFGKRSILLFSGADDPNNNLQLVDTIVGVGCVARDTVEQTGTDVLFLDYTGLRSLQRSIATQSNPLSDVSKNVRDDLTANILANKGNDFKNLRGAFYAAKGFYVFIGAGRAIWCFDLKFPIEGQQARVTTWSGINATDVVVSNDLLCFSFDKGLVGYYSGFSDNTVAYTLTYHSSWMDFGTTNIKIPKKLRATFVDGDGVNVLACTAYNFKSYDSSCFTTAIDADEAASTEWGLAYWAESEWSPGSVTYTDVAGNVGKSGHHIQVQVRAPVKGVGIAIQNIELQVKGGRVSRAEV